MRKRKVRPHFENLRVIDAGSKGKAIAKAPDGRVVFISGAVPGDLVSVQISRKRKGYYEGYVTELHEASEDRITPKCIHFGTCGGCKWQNMSYEAQLKFKQKEVVENLIRIGKLELPDIDPILPAPEPFYYRNKMEFSFSNNRWLQPHELEEGYPVESKNGLGLHIPGMWDKVLDLEECHLMADPVDEIRLSIRDFAENKGLSFFDPRKHTGLLRTLMVRSTTQGSLMLVLQFFEDDRGGRELLMEYLKESFPQISSLYYTVNQKKNDTIYDQELVLYWGAACIYESMEGLQFQITPKSFYQTNSEQAYQLYRKVREFAGLTGSEIVYDLYTGLGTIAQFIASEAGKVIGIESIPEAVEAARENARTNKIKNATFFSGDMKDLFSLDFVAKNGVPDVLITDPPRDGMHKDVTQRILEITPERIVYVSCNSATQARDLALMKDVYEVVKVQPVDMFPQTHHVENVVLLRRRNNP